ncbi:aldehyde-activating protein [Salipiger pallidus]|uniref:Aldehyde-activating protein n=1 Tax=Salipiger pallidus TaxID=1775170 RepID=A0A8J3EGF5_9RHOB|nr:GFA family protein [Salipiger pallidus]GGG67291.1 aldehyde-activating protein [Salipiger pallidus]
MTQLPATGRCRCGAVTLTVTALPVMTAACHCTGCRKMSASAFSLSMMLPAEGLEVSGVAPVRGGAGEEPCTHMCCSVCHGWLFTRITGMDGLVNVRPTLFDAPDWAMPFIETMCEEKLPWANTPAAHRFDRFPEPEDFGSLMEAYRDRQT